MVSTVGFEPTSANTVELESTPLDRSGTLTRLGFQTPKNTLQNTIIHTHNHTHSHLTPHLSTQPSHKPITQPLRAHASTLTTVRAPIHSRQSPDGLLHPRGRQLGGSHGACFRFTRKTPIATACLRQTTNYTHSLVAYQCCLPAAVVGYNVDVLVRERSFAHRTRL